MPKVFISHSNQDSDQTLYITDSLKRAGIGVWVDFENIRGGADWLCEIQAGIERCDAVVVILSAASAKSVWVERECLYAHQLRKPVFTALVADILIPLHLINIQYCDLRAGPAQGMARLVDSIRSAGQSDEAANQDAPAALSRQPIEANFFPYLGQLPDGEMAATVALDLFRWARAVADEVAFGGETRPGFQARVVLGQKLVTVFSVRAFRRRTAVQIPLDHLAVYKPFTRRTAREASLRKLNKLLPKSARFDADRADRRPTIPLHYLADAKSRETFKRIALSIIAELRSRNPQS
ncbi:MAG: toll/interleukin-1 receptor domain-containing protein [Chloroflexi bacterium]|nr:toll/interleukin-1 receptor domain-containing protein [Chloroflexota bacterium]